MLQTISIGELETARLTERRVQRAFLAELLRVHRAERTPVDTIARALRQLGGKLEHERHQLRTLPPIYCR